MKEKRTKVTIEEYNKARRMHCFLIQENKHSIKFYPEDGDIYYNCSLANAYRICKKAWSESSLLREYDFAFNIHEIKLLSLPSGVVVYHKIKLSGKYK